MSSQVADFRHSTLPRPLLRDRKEDVSLSHPAPITAPLYDFSNAYNPITVGSLRSRATMWWYEPFLYRRAQPWLLMHSHSGLGDRDDRPDENERATDWGYA
jgi:hypothetical protein